MSPRNPDPRMRLPSIAAKIQTIRGFSSAEERMLFLRIANLVDAAVVAERGIGNPEGGGKRFSLRVPVPSNLTTRFILSGIEVIWDTVDFDNFQAYEIQFSDTTTFASFTSQITTVARATIRDANFTDIFIRVRTLSRTGQASGFSSTASLTIIDSVNDVDGDVIYPENRTTVNPQPQLLGVPFAAIPGDTYFVGMGAAVGPGPLTFYDESQGGQGDPTSQISYVLEENDTEVDILRAGLPTFFDESSESFYPFVDGSTLSPGGARRFNVFSGSISDFFYIQDYTETPATMDIRLLPYFNKTNHEQTGTIITATLGMIKL